MTNSTQTDGSTAAFGGTTSVWGLTEDEALQRVGATRSGLSSHEAERRLEEGSSPLHGVRTSSDWRLLIRQFQSPIVLLLLVATALSMLVGELIDGAIIFAITGASAMLGFVQERGAVRVVEGLLESVEVHTEVLRDGDETPVLLDDVVVGDVVVLRTGDVVAADARVLRSDSLLLDESALTGESFPIEKEPGIVGGDAALTDHTNAVWGGTHVVSGSGRVLVMNVGADTRFGQVGRRLAEVDVPTAFELGLRDFGFLLIRTGGVLVAAVFVINLVLHRPVLESVLFSLALVVGLTPQLLPAIVTVTLAAGARQMAERKVIVKRLDAIGDIGLIDTLCTDKTGTLTDGTIELDQWLDVDGAPSQHVRDLAWINATSQSAFDNPIDTAIARLEPAPQHVEVIDELAYDFSRRMLSVLVRVDETPLLISKGAVDAVVGRCRLDTDERDRIEALFAELSMQGFRVLGLATKNWDDVSSGEEAVIASTASTVTTARNLTIDDERDLEFVGLLCFSDPPKAGAVAAIRELKGLAVTTKVITGDNRYAAAHIAAAVGLDPSRVITGVELAQIDAAEIDRVVEETVVFCELDPLEKEQVLQSMRRSGHSVGYLGDGINDAPSLKVADVGISVDNAVDVAKNSASIVLLDKDLAVLAEGIRQGRRVIANTIKYVQITISANFGNVVSLAIVTALLPFLPLLPRQILLLNLITDFPYITIAADRVDPEEVDEPHPWDTGRLRRFMIFFGAISAAFDLVLFAILRYGLHVGEDAFHTAWFVGSTATELTVMFLLRTGRPVWRSRPGTGLVATALFMAVITIALPWSPIASSLGLGAMSVAVMVAVGAVAVGYALATELAKRFSPVD